MRVRVLGAVGVWVDGAEVPLPGGKPRAILAMLALADGRPVAADALVTGLWGEEPSRTAAKTLQVHVSALRSRLREVGIGLSSSGGSYHLDVDPEQIDIVCFERLAEQGFTALNDERFDVSSRALQSAIDQWTGDPLANVLDAPFAALEADRLRLRLLAVTQARIEADLSLGLGVTLVDETRAIAAANPYDERACGQLMMALYRAGQSAAALDAFQAMRYTLGEELGLDIGPELAELERQVLVHDDRLLAQPIGKPAKRSNLPDEVSRFIGRDTEVRMLRENVQRSRLTTVTGAGGAGKTRLALNVAGSLLDDFPDGVWLLELAPLAGEESVTASLAAALAARGTEGGLDGVVEHIGDDAMLIVLDNCEHIIDDAASVAHRLLRRCANLHILATSREPLAIDGEQVYRLPPLTLVAADNADLDEICNCDAVRLFADRASLQDAGFVVDAGNASAAVRICRRLDGMPLAIELAAAKLRIMPIEDLAARLDERFNVLTSSSRQVLVRQQTLRALIDWSYDLLSTPEQQMLNRLSVFVGGFTLDAADAVCSTDSPVDAFELVTALVDKSLVEANEQGSGRFRLLETIREYAAERLSEDAGSADAARRSHAAFYLDLAEAASPALDAGLDMLDWLERLSADHDNLRAAAQTFVDDPDTAEEGLRFVHALRHFWHIRGHYLEGASMSTAALTHPAARELTDHYVVAMCTAVDMLERIGDVAVAGQLAEKAALLATGLMSIDLQIQAALRTSMLAARREQPREALELLDPYVDAHPVGSLAIRLPVMRAYVYTCLDQYVDARDALETAAVIARASGDVRHLAMAVSNLAVIDLAEGLLDGATRHLQEAQDLAARMGDTTTLLYVDGNLGLLAVMAGDYALARVRYREGLLLDPTGNDAVGVLCCLLGMTLCSTADSAYADSLVLHGFIGTAHQASPTVFDPTETAAMNEDRDRVRAAVGETEFTDGLERGSKLSIAEAIAFARSLR